MTERLSDELVESHRKVHSLAHLGDPITLSLLNEVQASRKLVADLLGLCDGDDALDDVREMIEASGCSADT